MYSGILPLVLGSSQVALCPIGQEVTAFGLVFVNTTGVDRIATLSIFRQLAGAAQTVPVHVKANSREVWDKPIVLQSGDHLDVWADDVGVSLVWSLDVDTGSQPVAQGFVVRGNWSNVTAYNANDVVNRNGSSYAALAANTGYDPAVNTAQWMLLLDGSGIQSTINSVIGGAPASLDTLGELAAAIGNDPAFSTKVATKDSPVFTGTVNASQVFALTGSVTPPQITAGQNDYHPAGSDLAFEIRVSADVPHAITGFGGGSAGRMLLLTNITAAEISLTNEDALSAPVNRFWFGSGTVILKNSQSALFRYSATLSRWVGIAYPQISESKIARRRKAFFRSELV